MSTFIRSTPPAAEWLRPSELDDPYFAHGAGKILLGQRKDGRKIGVADNRHIVTIAGSRAGKSATSLMPNLLEWRGSVLAIDPKGELATNTAKHRADMGQNVVILDPFGEVKGEAAQYRKRFDPLSEIKAGSEVDIIDNAALIADSLIVPAEGNKNDHWSLSAKNIVRGFILWALAQEAKGKGTASLNQMREWLTMPLENDDDDKPDMMDMFSDMMEDDAFDGVVSGVGGTMYGKPDGERGSVISTAVEQTAFLDSSPMRDHFSGSDLTTLRALKRQPTTIYLVLPASRMATHFRWFRMVITLAMSALESEPSNQPDPVLFILEEFPQLGYMRQLEAAAGLMAGYDVKIWAVIQDLSQIRALYKDSWETFVGNAGIIEAFGNTDATTLEYLSKKIGMTLSRQVQPDNPSLQAQQGGARPERETVVTVPLLATHELALQFARENNNKLVMIAGRPPFVLRRVFWKDMISG